MFKKLMTIALVGAAVSVSTGVLSPITAFAGPPEGPATIALSGGGTSGTGSTAFNITLPALASCSGVGGANYRWETFIASSSIDVSSLIFLDGPNQPASTFTSSLTDTSGNLVKQKFPGFGGLISGIPQLNFSSLIGSGITAGTFKVGVFCADLNTGGTVGRLDAGHYWETLITVSNPTTMAFSLGAAPVAPVLGALTGALSSFTGSFTATAATPAVGANGYTITAVPTAGTGFPGGTVTQSFSATGAFTFSTPLSNATTYSVSMTATNTAGTSPVSNTLSVVVNPPARPAVTNLGAVPGIGSVVLNWTTPTGVAPTGYSVAVSPTVAGAPFTLGAVNTLTVTALCTLGVLNFTVTPLHTAPFTGLAASISATSNCDGTVIQDITVVRPAGALVLTQRCGVNGPLPIEPASPGFAALPAVIASLSQIGTAPTLTAGGAVGDPQFGSYPNPSPVAAETHCGVNLQTAQLVTSGALSGQYYAANGIINQVTVSDTRDTDTGWTVNGTMSAFTVNGGGASFSGNYLGWSPVVTSTSGALSNGYDQTATPGASVLPDTAAGLATPKTLSRALPGFGLGIASFDARLKLLIPLSARAGTYTGTLTFTIV